MLTSPTISISRPNNSLNFIERMMWPSLLHALCYIPSESHECELFYIKPDSLKNLKVKTTSNMLQIRYSLDKSFN